MKDITPKWTHIARIVDTDSLNNLLLFPFGNFASITSNPYRISLSTHALLSVNLTASCMANQTKLYMFNHPPVSSPPSVRHNSVKNS